MATDEQKQAVHCINATNNGSDSISLKFCGDFVLFSEVNQHHAVRDKDFNIRGKRPVSNAECFV